ncbi:MAG: PH domain-containing protein [Candidatus Saccharimonadales bacterium]
MQYDQLEPEETPKDRVSPDLTVLQPGEEKIATIKRSPIGIILIYSMSLVVIAIVALFVLWILPGFTQNSTVISMGRLGLGIVLIISIISMLIFTVVYWGNYWILTSDSMTQVSQTGLFKRSASQLSLSDIEDVTADQQGILPELFNYGELKLETAGSTQKYQLNFSPNPNYYAREILAARETFVEKPADSRP